jgi:ATP-dependent helicase/nuclease subunit A
MSPPLTYSELADAAERERAVCTFDQNLIVTAGAGTGKTALLVDRLVELLLRSPEPLRITEIVALTFTNKAANEIKFRLRERLESYLAARLDREPLNDVAERTEREILSLIERYRLSKDELDGRVREALRNLERSEIGTIHSFAATLLRLYPLEAGLDPQFKEDDGKEFERIFDEQWELWLDQELNLASTHADDWRSLLRKLKLEEIKALAQSLCSEAVELEPKAAAKEDSALALLQAWLESLEARATALLEVYPEERQNEKLLRAAREIIREFRRPGGAVQKSSSEARSLVAEKSINKDLQGWSEADLLEAQELLRVARGLEQVDPALCQLLWGLLVPFAEKFREVFAREGFVSFDGLLVRARNLLRDCPRVREELKRQFRAILIDEFQDTDPIQYEILLYLAEEAKRAAKDWRHIKLSPGKVFVVGDPKQSIYAFRRADIEAYLEVVDKFIKAQNGAECRLTTNFRSHADLIKVVNGVFERLIQPRDGVQPSYIAIDPAPGRTFGDPTDTGSLPKVMVRRIIARGGELNVEKARRLEGESLARLLKEEIIEKALILNSSGERVAAQPRNIAILFRKLTDIHDYLEPLRRNGIPYVVEGERHFYAAKEIIDAVNLFRAIANPYDRLALVGVLRSPLGGLTDQTIYELHRANLLDYREVKKLGAKAFPTAVTELYQKLDQLHKETQKLPIGAAVSHIFDCLPLKALAASAFHGEQAVANLEKLRQQADLLGRGGWITLKEAIHELRQRVLDVKEEGESALAEEGLDAVKIMSIHKAKGLEFPIVILAGCQTGTDGRRARTAEVTFDWSTGLSGLRVGRTWDFAGLYIAEKARLRAEEEQKRVFYVAMTRAKEHLILSCAPSSRRSPGSFLSMLEEAVREAIATTAESKSLSVGRGRLELEVVSESLAAPGRAKPAGKKIASNVHWQPYVEAWARRRKLCETVAETPVFLTPTLLKGQEEDLCEAVRPTLRWPTGRTPALALGELAHRFLEAWDFAQDTEQFAARLDSFLDRWLPPELAVKREEISGDLREIFGGFFGSKIHLELAQSKILGREVPLLMPWNGQIMEGVIDLIYEHDGLIYLADYKSDRIARRDLAPGAARYRQQAQVYSRAAGQSLQREIAGFKVIFLRLGEAVSVPGDSPEKISSAGQLSVL